MLPKANTWCNFRSQGNFRSFQTADVVFKVTQGYLYWRNSTAHIWFPID